MSIFHSSLWGNKHGDTFFFFFFQLFAKNSLIKNIIISRRKKFDCATWFFFLENSSVFGVFELMRGLQASPQPGNQKRSKWSNTAHLNNRSFMSKIKFFVFQVAKTQFCKKVIRIFNAKPVKIPQLKSLLTRKQARWPHFFIAFFFYVHTWMLTMQSFKKNWIVEKFQGNYLNYYCVSLNHNWLDLTWLATPDPIPFFLKWVDWLQLQPKRLNIL